MSPSWRDRIEVFLGPDAVELTHIRRGLRPKPGLAHRQSCEGGANLADWRPAIDALERALAALAWKNADARIALSNQFVRFALIAGIAVAANERERAELARHQLRTVYGDQADAWETILGEAGKDAVAAAVDPELIAALRAALAARSIAVQAVEPFFAVAYNAALKLLPAEASWLAVAEPGRLVVAHLAGSRWTALRSQRVREPLHDALPAALEQCRLANGIEADGGDVCLVTRERTPTDWPEEGRWRIRAVTPTAASAAGRPAG